MSNNKFVEVVGLKFELEGASVDAQAVRSRFKCRLTTLNLKIRPFWKTSLVVLEASIYCQPYK